MTSQCLEWKGRRHNQGYGVFYTRGEGKTVLAHRYVYEVANGPIPTGMMVCHKCDNPPCINIQHLYLGTAADNNRDMVKRGRQAHGERCGQSKLTNGAVKFIREHYQPPAKRIWTQAGLAREFGVSRAAIGYIVRGRNWREQTS